VLLVAFFFKSRSL